MFGSSTLSVRQIDAIRKDQGLSMLCSRSTMFRKKDQLLDKEWSRSNVIPSTITSVNVGVLGVLKPDGFYNLREEELLVSLPNYLQLFKEEFPTKELVKKKKKTINLAEIVEHKLPEEYFVGRVPILSGKFSDNFKKRLKALTKNSIISKFPKETKRRKFHYDCQCK